MTPNPAMQPPVLAFGEHSRHTLRVLGAADLTNRLMNVILSRSEESLIIDQPDPHLDIRGVSLRST
jgi:hypothetical protein